MSASIPTVLAAPAAWTVDELQAAYEAARQRIGLDTGAPSSPPLTSAPASGQYILLADLFDQPLSEPGEEFRYRRHYKHDIVTLDAAEAKRLLAAGAVCEAPAARRDTHRKALAAYHQAKANQRST